MELAITSASAPTYSGRERISTASWRLALLSASSHWPARISALTTRLWVSGLASAQLLETPKTFSDMFLRMA
ncbi:hypothetical protein D9M69_672190 [compost metagenome]